jgi:hypothetical protein
MKHIFYSLVLSTLALAGAASAQEEAVPLEKAQAAAEKINASLGKLTDAPFAVDADTAKPQAAHADEVAVMIVPDKKLSAQAIAAAGKEILPVGQLWMVHVAVAQGEKAAPKDKLRHVSFDDGEKTHDVSLYLLGIAKNEQGVQELLVFGNGKEPIARAALTTSADSTQSLPLQISGRKETDNSGVLTVSLAGQYKADVRLVKPEE